MKIRKSIVLGLLILTSPGLSSCRFGNYSEPPRGVKNFNSIELFSTKVKKLETFALYQDDSETHNLNAPLSAVPAMILDNFTNPVYITEPTGTPGVHLFIGLSQTQCMLDPVNSDCIGTLLNEDGSIGVSTSSEFQQFGSNPACRMNLQMQQFGYLDRSNPSTITYSDGSTGIISGDLLLEFRLIRNFQGDCSGILGRLASCYSDGSGCSTDELYWANQLFDLYIRQTGALRIEDTTRIKTLAYIVHFD
ncbi:MAG: hypothetical protein KGP28_08170 [Bdellovibrionales bacterium]|nr:hypothetical protein [Bdellovibrionales bacterium]